MKFINALNNLNDLSKKAKNVTIQYKTCYF